MGYDMIHQYKLNGYNIVLDVCSGSIHLVDEIAYDLIAGYENEDRDGEIAIETKLLALEVALGLLCKDIDNIASEVNDLKESIYRD